jgi:glucose/arabinose dehydrogenase
MRPLTLLPLLALAAACNAAGEGVEAANGSGATASAGMPVPTQNAPGKPFAIQPLGDFEEPWAMAFLPNGTALVTERKGKLMLWSRSGDAVATAEVAGVPEVDYGGQGGLGDVVLHPNFARNRLVYLSWVEAGPNDTRGAVVGRARLAGDAAAPRLEGLQVVWRQSPKVEGRGHFGHRIAFGPDGKLYISNGDRQKFDPAQDMSGTLGKIVRLNDDGTVPADNPFASRGGTTAQIWTLGHRNPLGLAFAPDGKLWSHEMGPKRGDEFNLIERGTNYGYPVVSNGNHYDGKDIPDHDTRPEFNAPEITFHEVSPAGLAFYTGTLFPAWRGNAFMGGRIREVEAGPDGAIWVLEDGGRGSEGRLLRLAPAGR